MGINCDFHVRFRLCSRVGCLRMCTTVPRGSEMFGDVEVALVFANVSFGILNLSVSGIECFYWWL